jgi:hypothetical protein
MNEIYINLIIIFIIIILFLAYILIAYFYDSYKNNKEKVNSNFIKTKNYINNTTSNLDDNIKTTTNKITLIDTKTNDRLNKIDTRIIDMNNSNSININNLNRSLNENRTYDFNISSNLNRFDNNLNQYIEFKENNNIINDTIFNYRFGVAPDLSMNLLRQITAISGMTVMTDNLNKSFRICDTGINNCNCVDMNINNGNFDIYPSSTQNNSINNINIYNKNKQKILGRFDLQSNNIYLGGNNEDAGLFIHDSNVYFKNFNLLSNNTNYSDSITSYNKNNHDLNQPFNNYNFNIDDIKKINQQASLINGMYTIIKGSTNNTNSIIFNFKSSFDISYPKSIPIDIYELANTDPSDVIIANTEPTSLSIIPSGKLNKNKITFSIANDKKIDANTNIRLKITDTKLNLPTTIYTNENYISNTISTIAI